MRTLATGALVALLTAVPAAAQYDPPGVFISPATGTVTQRTQAVRITWSHEYDLVSTSRVIKLNNNVVTGNFTYQSQTTGNNTGAGVLVVSTDTVTLADGANTLSAYICSPSWGCTEEVVTLTYTPPPPPAQHASPVVSLAPYHPGYSDPVRHGSSLTYTTPSYRSLDQDRAVTLYYSSELAEPRPLIQFDVTDHSLTPAERFEVRVLNGSTALTLSNGTTVAVFSNAGGTTGGTARLGVELDPSAAGGNAAYNYTLQVTSVWSSGTQPPATTAALRVPVIHRGGSGYGSGWGVKGLQRILPQSDGLLVDEGDGSARFHAGTGPAYTRPDGDFSTITRAGNGTYQRTWPTGSGAWFDATGRLSYTYNLAGDTTRYYYAMGDMLSQIVDPAGQAIVFDYHPGYYLAGITVPGSRRTQFWYAGTDIYEIIEPDGTRALQQLSHSAGHRLNSWVDRGGGQWNVTYGPQRAVTITGPQITVNGTLQRPATTLRTEKKMLAPASGQGTTASPLPRLTADSVYATITDPRGYTTRTTLDRYGNPLSMAGPLGHTTVYERNLHGQPVRITTSGGGAVNLDWNTDGSIARSFDESRGMQVDYTYQTLSGSTFLSRSSEGVVNTEYDRGTRGEVLRVRVGTDTVARFTYDSRLRVKTMTDRGGHVVEYFYDATAWKHADSVRLNTSAGNQRTAFAFDAAGRTSAVTAPDGRVTTFTYDVLNRVLKQRAPGDSVRYAYDGRGLWRVTDAAGKNYDVARNAMGWVVAELDADGDTTGMRYDLGGNIVGTTDRLGRTFAMRYDATGRLDSLAAPDATIKYGFDNPNGLWVWAERVGESRDTLYLNPSGRITNRVAWMNGVRYEVANTWRVDGLPSQVVVRAGPMYTPTWQESMSYGYDGRLRLTSMTDHAGYSTTVGYNAESLPGTITWPGSSATLTLGYTPRHRINSLSYNRTALNTGLGAGTLAYDVLDRMTSRSTSDGKVTSYGYDALGRLSGRDEVKQVYVPPPPFCEQPATEPECLGYYDWASVRTYGFNYDAVDNRTTWSYSDSTGAWGSYSSAMQASSNRYSTFAGWTLAYDSVGNLVSRTNGTQTVQYQWNTLGQLTGVYTPSTGWIYYGYNAFGVRVRRTTAAGATIRYLYDGDDLVAEVDGSGNRIRTYAYWPGVDQPHSMRTWENGAGGAVHFYGMELPSSTVRGLFNLSGTLTHSYTYSPYGEKLRQSEGTHNPLRFGARELDWQTGMYYVRARWYDPFLGRFLSEDPTGLAGGVNQYAYALNDPVNLSDPSGLAPCPPVCGGTVYLPPVTVNGGAPHWTDDFFTSAIDQKFSLLGGLRDTGEGPLTPEEQSRITCTTEAYVDPTVAEPILGMIDAGAVQTGTHLDENGQASAAAWVPWFSETMVFQGSGPRGYILSFHERDVAATTVHEYRHILQQRMSFVRVLYGLRLYDVVRQAFEADAEAYAAAHVSTPRAADGTLGGEVCAVR